jgi:hypothetical protein
MGVDTKAKLTSNPSYETIVEAMKTLPNFSNVRIETTSKATMKSYIDRETKLTSEYFDEGHSYIMFDFKNDIDKDVETRSMFCIEKTYDKSENSCNAPFTPEQYAYLSLGAWGGSVQIMKDICGVLSGIVIPDDCADEDSEDYFEIINSKTEFVLDTKLQILFDSLTDMNVKEKYDFVHNIRDNQEKIALFLSA